MSAAIFTLAMLGCATSKPVAQLSGDQCVVRDGKVFDVAGRPMAGCVARFDGVYMTTLTGELVHMKHNMLMTNGTKCLVDGTCIMKDGSRRKLKQGEVLTPEGRILRAKGWKAEENS